MKTKLLLNLYFTLTSIFNQSLIQRYNPYTLTSSRVLKRGISLIALLIFTSVTLHAQLPDDKKDKFQQVNLLTGLKNSTTMKFAPDGRIFILDRYGEIIIYKPDTQSSLSAGTLSVFHELEDGLLGIAFDPKTKITSEKIEKTTLIPSKF